MECYQFSKLVITIIMYLDNYDYKNHDDLIIISKNNHDISIFNDNCPTLPTAAQVVISTLALSSQHSRCIETHTKVRPITSLTLSLVIEDVKRELRRTT